MAEQNEDILMTLVSRSSFTFEEKMDMIRTGRPQPPLPDLKTVHKDKTKQYTRSFQTNQYNVYPWLTGSVATNKLYCWPCLLFSRERTSPFCSSGFSNLCSLTTTCSKHSKSISHIRAFADLKIFGSQRIDHSLDRARKACDEAHNAKVKENRQVLTRLIDTVIFLGKQECPFRGHDESSESLNKGMYVELLEHCAINDPVLANHLKTSTTFKGTSASIQNDLIEAVAGVLSDEIKLEISKSSFVAILLDETTDIANQSQLSTVFRYVNNEGISQERFLFFTDVSKDRTAKGLFEHVVQVVENLGCGNKLVAQTFDGAAVMSGHVSGLQTLVRSKYPAANFIHCYSHKLNLVLSKSCSSIKECKIFFKSLGGVPSFFSHSTTRTEELKNFMVRKLPGVAPTRWNFSSRLVNTIQTYRSHLVGFFSSMQDNVDSWSSEEINMAIGFETFLCKFETKFLLLLFSEVFSYSDVLFSILQNKSIDIVFCTQEVGKFKNKLKDIKENSFEKIWTQLEDHDEHRGSRSDRRETFNRDKYSNLHEQILSTLIEQTDLRFQSQSFLTFVGLLDKTNMKKYAQHFPDNLFANLTEGPYASHFDFVRLKSELVVIYSQDDYHKPINNLVQFLKSCDLDASVFTEVYKLGVLIASIPSTTSSVERSFSSLKRIKTYLRATQGQERLSSLGLLSIEKGLLSHLRTNVDFYDKVTAKFLQKNRRIDLNYK